MLMVCRNLIPILTVAGGALELALLASSFFSKLSLEERMFLIAR